MPANLEDETARLRQELAEACAFAETVLARARADTAALRSKLAAAEQSRDAQERNTLAFRADWLREMGRADKLVQELAQARAALLPPQPPSYVLASDELEELHASIRAADPNGADWPA